MPYGAALDVMVLVGVPVTAQELRNHNVEAGSRDCFLLNMSYIHIGSI